MCFSATASFTAGTALSVVGGLSLRRSKGRRELPLALVPLLFGIQQLVEGVLWLSFRNDLPLLRSSATYVFTLFSHVLWPMFVPLAILLVETGRRRRTAISLFQALGVGVGLYLLYFVVRYPVVARIDGRSIFYDTPHLFKAVALTTYLLATCATGLLSRHRCIQAFGLLLFVLAVAAYAISVTTFVSVWCFFAAILSLLIYAHFNGPMQVCRPALQSTHRTHLERAGPRPKVPAAGNPLTDP